MSQLQSLPIEELRHTPHDIFLSHSGAQKGFVKDLYKALRGSYSTFLDITHHSLPLGENFPHLILEAAKNCKLAVVVLSEEFVSSKWPMIELAAFVAAAKVKILPLFFTVSPSDLKEEKNLQRWRKAWNSYAEQDSKHRIDVAKWDSALQALSSRNGCIFDPTAEGEQSFLDRFLPEISRMWPSTIKFDTGHIHGKDRLCKVIWDKFKGMESRAQENEDRGSGFKPACVLGVYGMPGSGKSTLCKCLQDEIFHMYGPGKVLYLKAPQSRIHADWVPFYRGLLSLTDFREWMPLDNVELEEVVYLLRHHKLSSCRVFLVIDNISDGSREEVQRLCKLGFGPGSKVILVARSRDVLHPILKTIENDGSKCICDCVIPMPTINEEEAIQIILQRIRALDGSTLQEKESIILGIVRKCGFRSDGVFLYLPLVLNTMGGMLITYNKNLEGWRSDMECFWTRVETYKEHAVLELIEESFKKLPDESHRLLFLDVVLFILPLEIQNYDAHICLSSMHGKTAERMEMMMTDLERQCFLTVSKGGFVEVHDVYIEFAKSKSKGPDGFSNCLWIQERHADEICGLRRLTLKPESEQIGLAAVRAMILQEVGPSCERIDLEGFSSLKALCVRKSQGLKVLGLAGSTSQLVSLDITHCPNFQRLECRDGHDYASLLKMKRLNVDLAGWGMWGSKEMTLLRRPNLVGGRIIKWVAVLMQRVFATKMLHWGWNSFNVGNMVRQMRNLQALHIHNTGIPRLEDMSSYWPQLQVLTVMEYNLEALELGKLPDLRVFLFCDHEDGHLSCHRHCLCNRYENDIIVAIREEFVSLQYKMSDSWRRKQGNPRFMLSGKDLLVGCPRLEGVFMESAFFEEGEPRTLPSPNLSCLTLRCLDSMAQLPDLSSSAHTLQELYIQSCEQLTRVALLVRFENLVKLFLADCPKLVEVTGLEGLPNLQTLYVLKCDNLQSLNGFDNARMLHTLRLCSCRLLKQISCLNGNLANLETLEVSHCHPNLHTFMAAAGLHGLIKLEALVVGLNGQSGTFSLGELEHLKYLCVREDGVGGSAFEGWEKLVNLETLELRGKFENLSTLPLYKEKSMTAKLIALLLFDLNAVTRLDGIEHHVTLETLQLCGLQNLRSAQGLEFLINLQHLRVQSCPMLDSLPSLHTLRNVHELCLSGCAKLKAIEGCDQMKKLSIVLFDGCTSLAAFPLANLDVPLSYLRFEGCKFARDVEMMLACLGDKEAPYALRKAWLQAWVWLYDQERQKLSSSLLRVGDRLRDKVMTRFEKFKYSLEIIADEEFQHIVENITTLFTTYRTTADRKKVEFFTLTSR